MTPSIQFQSRQVGCTTWTVNISSTAGNSGNGNTVHVPVVQSTATQIPFSSSLDADVVIVGAGLSGLSSARNLQAQGISTIVLEAKDRVGGKTKTVSPTSGVGAIDVGAAWINDKTQPRMTSLLREFGFEGLIQSMHGDDVFLGEDAKVYRTPFDQMPPGIHDKVVRISKLCDEEMQKLEFLDAKARAAYDDMSAAQFFQNMGAEGTVLKIVSTWVKGGLGNEADTVSLLYFLEYVKTCGGMDSYNGDDPNGAQHMRVRQGTQSFAMKIVSQLQPNSVYLDAAVKNITQRDGRCLVSVAGGRQFWCKKVIVSIPTPLYKDISFIPALPAAKQELAESTFLGEYVKYLLVYSTPWWRDIGLSGRFVSLEGPISFSRDVSSDEDGLFVLSCLIFGDLAYRWTRTSRKQKVATVLAQLASSVGKEHQHLVRETLVETIEQQWTLEHWSEGAPCPATPPGVWSRLGHTLAEPYGHIHFTGAETARVWRGYMEGAVESGERGAAEVIQALQKLRV